MHTEPDISYEMELQQDWEENRWEPNEFDLLETFPEARQFYLDEMRLLVNVCKRQEIDLEIYLGYADNLTGFTKVYYQMIICEFVGKDLLENRKRLEHLTRLLFPKEIKGTLTTEDIERARHDSRTNIWNLMGGKKFIKCPFHKERSPSMHLYRNKEGAQIYYCFGCGATGDIIDFVMKTEGCDFITAVKKLI
jgi:hypothetical protein